MNVEEARAAQADMLRNIEELQKHPQYEFQFGDRLRNGVALLELWIMRIETAILAAEKKQKRKQRNGKNIKTRTESSLLQDHGSTEYSQAGDSRVTSGSPASTHAD